MNRPRLSAVVTVLVMTVLTGCGNSSSVPAASPQAAGTEAAVVGTVTGRQLSAYTSPEAARPFLRLSATTPFGSPRVVLVRAVRGSWLQVLLPVRPNGSTGWVRRSELTLTKVRHRVRVSLAARQLVIYRGEQELFRTTAAVGATATPTPNGLYFVTDVVRTSSQQAAYGPYALGLSGHSPVLERFGDGDAQIALHGTSQPQTLGQAVSKGCVRIGNTAITRLAKELPLGTPVQIDAR